MTLLELRDVVAGYQTGPDILRGMNLAVKAGQVQCIIGPNGAGKSTLLKVVAGLLKPRQGEVLFKGEPIHHLRPDQVLAGGICFVPQERALFPEMTVTENLRMGGYVLNNKPLVAGRIEEVYAVFPDLKEKRNRQAQTLSGGQQQMLAMGRALVLQPEIIMIDEPSLGLAPLIVEEIFKVLAQLKERGMTLLLVEQNARKGLECSDWGCVLDLGKNRFDGPAESILDDPRIQELYLGSRKTVTQEMSA